jgi:hypothetical protein
MTDIDLDALVRSKFESWLRAEDAIEDLQPLLAEVERLREHVDHPQGGAALGITWPIDRLAPDGIPWIEHYNTAELARAAVLDRADKAEAERDEARAEVERLRDRAVAAEASREDWKATTRRVSREAVEARAAVARVEALCDEAEREQGCSEALLNSDQIRVALRGDQP